MLYNMRKEYILHTSKGMEKMYATTDLEIIKAITDRMIQLKAYKDSINATTTTQFKATCNNRIVCDFIF